MTEAVVHRAALPEGTRIGDFEFHRVLGHGGFGLTYLAWNLGLDLPVAIKEYLPADLAIRSSDRSVVPKSTSDEASYEWGLQRFLEEARTLGRFKHPNIVKVYHFFRAHGTGYIVMEYAEGETLAEILNRKGSLAEPQLKPILLPLLAGLEEVHRANFLHRDIKPSNIVIRPDGAPVLIDFGSARQAIGAKSRSVTSIVTPGYAPIEQYSTKGDQGAWTDIYALAAVCYRALTGEPPADATERVRRDPLLPAVDSAAGRAALPFLRAIDWALSVDEKARPQTIEAWRTALLEPEPLAQAAPAAAAAARPTGREPKAVGKDLSRDSTAAGEGTGSGKRGARPRFSIFRVLFAVCWIAIVGAAALLVVEEQQRERAAAAERQRAAERERIAEAERLRQQEAARLVREQQEAEERARAAEAERRRQEEAARLAREQQEAEERARAAEAERRRQEEATRRAREQQEAEERARQALAEQQRQRAQTAASTERTISIEAGFIDNAAVGYPEAAGVITLRQLGDQRPMDRFRTNRSSYIDRTTYTLPLGAHRFELELDMEFQRASFRDTRCSNIVYVTEQSSDFEIHLELTRNRRVGQMRCELVPQ